MTTDWEQRKFDEVISRIGTGLNPRDNFTLNTGGENYYVTIKNFEHGHLFLDENCDKVDDKALQKIQERSDLRVDDILFTSIGRIGDCYLIKKQPKNWNINESVFTLRPNQVLVDPEYIYHTIHSDIVLNQILNGVTGSTFKSIKIGDLKKTDIPVPGKAEQKQIAMFVSNLDNLITLHQRKYCRVIFKSSMSVDKKNTYFFTTTWEQRKLISIVDRVTRKNTELQSTLPLTISAQYGLVDQITYFNNRVASQNISNYFLVKNGEFAYNKSSSDGYPFGAVKRLDLYEMGVLSTLYIVFALKDSSVDSDFLVTYYDTDNWHKQVSERAAEGARNHGLLNISAEDFLDTSLMIPTDIREQQLIGAFLKKLNNLITLHQREHIIYFWR